MPSSSRRLVRLILIAVLGAACAGPHSARPRDSEPASAAERSATFRLPDDEHAVAERASLDIDPSHDSFHGVVDLDVHLDRPRRTLWLHGRDLRVASVRVSQREATFAGTWRSSTDGLASITLDAPLRGGDATIHVEYDADYLKSNAGVAVVERGGERYVFTQLASIDARRAFPCFDEPSAKIPFTLSLTTRASDTAVANAPEDENTALPDGRRRVRFRATQPIPAYLVAFAVGPLDVVRAPDVPPNAIRHRAVPLRAIAARGRGKELAYALSLTPTIVASLEDYFAEPYPYDKLDILAVPDKGGAMENPGAITFEEYSLLVDDATVGVAQKREVLSTLTHEISHQWFGDLVTMAWWDDTWLNEGFATWMAAKMGDRIDPSAHLRLQELLGTDRAMTVDAREAARSVRQPIESTDDILNVLDAITYQKGGAVLGMFERSMGEDAFRGAIREHIAQHRFGTATASDLFAALSHAAKRDVSGPLRTFLDQPGVPFVEAKIVCDAHPHAHLSQSRYAPIGSGIPQGESWSIPVCARYGTGARVREACTMLEGAAADLPLEGCPDWLVPNADGAGYYRFGLASDDLAKVRRNVASLSRSEQVALAENLTASFFRGSTTVADLFETAGTLAEERESHVADDATRSFAHVANWLADDPARAAFEGYARTLARRAHDDLGWSDARGVASDPDRSLRRDVIMYFLALVARDPAVRAEAKRRALAFIGYGTDGRLHRDALDPDVAETALTVAAEDADPALFDALRAQLLGADDEPTRGMLVDALAQARNPAVAQRVYDMVLGAGTRGWEPYYVAVYRLRSPLLRREAWAWIRAHGDAMLAQTTDPSIRQHVLSLPERLCDASYEAEIDEYLARLTPQVEGGPREAAMARERAHLCAAQKAALLPSVREYLSAASKRSQRGLQ